jgi:hypothetical protein
MMAVTHIHHSHAFQKRNVALRFCFFTVRIPELSSLEEDEYEERVEEEEEEEDPLSSSSEDEPAYSTLPLDVIF